MSTGQGRSAGDVRDGATVSAGNAIVVDGEAKP
jgi:hypothetical protein